MNFSPEDISVCIGTCADERKGAAVNVWCDEDCRLTPFESTTSVHKGKVIPLQAGVAQRVGRGIALLFHDHGTRRG